MSAKPPLPNYTQGTQIWSDHVLKDTYTSIGKPGLQRVDGYDKASGRALFTRDIILPGMLHARWLTCPYAHAQITAMDSTDAAAYPGVRYILRYDDPEIKDQVNSPPFMTVWTLGSLQYYSGGPIGAVIVADTEQIAVEALKLLKVTWKELPAVTDLEAAAVKGAPVAVDGSPNYTPADPVGEGDIAAGFAAADQIVQCTQKKMTISGVGAEPMSCIVKWDGKGLLEFWHHTQVQNTHRKRLASYFGIPVSQVYSHQYCNGHLGGHFQWIFYDAWTMTLLGGILSRRLGGVPVKMLYDRYMDFNASAPSQHSYHAKIGVKNDGTITAVQANNYCCQFGFNSYDHIEENTCIENWSVTVNNMNVNVPHPGPMRCEQTNNLGFWAMIQSHVNAALNLDPTVAAPVNDGYFGHKMSDYGAAYKAAHGFPVKDSLADCIAKGKQVFGWDSKWHAPNSRQLSNGRWHGVGTVWTHSWQDACGDGGAGLFFNGDGSVSILCQNSDEGVNQKTTMIQIVLEELGVTAENIHWLSDGRETVEFATGPGSGSQSCCCNGWAFKYAAINARAAILDFACHDFQYTSGFGGGPQGDIASFQKAFFPGLTADDLDLQNNVIFEKANPDNKHTLAEVCANTSFGAGNSQGPGVFAWQYVGQPALADSYSNYVHYFNGRAMYFLEVEVDTETGEVFPTSVVPVVDVGKLLNPDGCYGQMYGACYMGWGRAVTEEQIFDAATNVLLNCNLYDYKVSTIKDVIPSVLNMQVIEDGMGFGPYGANGIGEHTATVLWSCLAPAIYNAVGVWVDDYPITPAKVLAALKKATPPPTPTSTVTLT